MSREPQQSGRRKLTLPESSKRKPGRPRPEKTPSGVSSLQDQVISQVVNDGLRISLVLNSGEQFEGFIKGMDRYAILFEGEEAPMDSRIGSSRSSCLIWKHAIQRINL